jgi:oligopeptide/dipeptide ABC transporter ATP-binding protein
MSYLFITHDINVIKYVSHRLGVLFYGRLVETGNIRDIAAEPKHPYTQKLIANVLTLGGATARETSITEHRPAPTGCRYRLVCRSAFEMCADVPPGLDLGSGHVVSCFLYAKGLAPLEELPAPKLMLPEKVTVPVREMASRQAPDQARGVASELPRASPDPVP